MNYHPTGKYFDTSEKHIRDEIESISYKNGITIREAEEEFVCNLRERIIKKHKVIR